MSSEVYHRARIEDPYFWDHVERAVRAAQEVLASQGLLSHEDVDGCLGPKTATVLSESFIQRYQRVVGGHRVLLGFDVARLALEHVGKSYVWGTEASAADPDPSAFDCSELVEWICARLGVQPRMPDGSWLQYRHCVASKRGAELRPSRRTLGELLFAFSSDPLVGGRPSKAHVAIVVDEKHVVEAKSRKDGVVKSLISDRTWTHVAFIPGVQY